MEIILFILFIVVIKKAVSYSKSSRSRSQNRGYKRPLHFDPPKFEVPPPLVNTPQEPVPPDYSAAYKRKYLFSRNEKHEFRKLLEWAQTNNYYVFPKVRLLDIIEPRSGHDYKLLNKIHAKHVDFVICDKDLRVKFIIELDDNSHDRKDRSERDEFVRQALSGAGYTLLQTRGISDAFLDGLKS